VSILEITWTGVDGSVWDLLGGTQGVRLAGGVRGLHLPDVSQVVQASSAMLGRMIRDDGAREGITNGEVWANV